MLHIHLIESDTRVIQILAENYLGLGFEFSTCDELYLLEEYEDEKKKVDIVIVRNYIDEEKIATKLLNYIYDKKMNIPVIILGELDISGFNYISLPERFRIEELNRAVFSSANLSENDIKDLKLPEYIAVKMRHFYLMSSSYCDIYIRLKKNKSEQFVKRLHAEDSFDKEVIKNYESRGLESMYIKKEDREGFFSHLLEESLGKIKNENSSLEKKIEIMGDAYEMSAEFLSEYGINETTIKIAEATINSMSKSISQSKKLGGLLKTILADKSSFSYKHSFLISLFSVKIIPMLDWGHQAQRQSNCEKISFVAFFHDMALKNPKLMEINSKVDMYNLNLTDEQKENVEKHANEMATIIQKYPHAPSGADIIIKQHHGVANGIGFARSITNSLSPMAILFIIVEDFVTMILQPSEKRKNITQVLDLLEAKYSLPSQRNIVMAFKETLKKI